MNRLCHILCFVWAAVTFFCPAGNFTRAWSQDLEDCALLFDSHLMENSDINFKVISQFYGLRLREIDLRSTMLSDSLLRDANGHPLAGIDINMKTLERTEPLLLDSLELSILNEAVQNGSHLLISGLSSVEANDLAGVRFLTDGRVAGVWPEFVNEDWIISKQVPEVTREFGDQVIPFSGDRCARSPIVTGSAAILIASSDRDNPAAEYPVFVALPLGAGMIFIDGAEQNYSLNSIGMHNLYYCYDRFHQIVPTMMFVRFAGGDECWHGGIDYANLTIDDPTLLGMQYGYLNFQDLLAEMQAYDFHTTIAMVPKSYLNTSSEVVAFFRDHSDKYSLVQHGNNHDGFEFFAYNSTDSLAVCLERGWCGYPPRPLQQQEADMVEGATRMAELERLTGLTHSRAMIFPYGIAPTPTLELLKRYDFLATVNGLSIPIGEQGGPNYDFNMRPTNLNYANFASCSRRHWWDDKLYLYDLFIDKPVLLYEHHGFFASGHGAFNAAAAAINEASSSVKWLGLGEILGRLHLQKLEDDGTISVRMFTNQLLLSNESSTSMDYRIEKEEWGNVPPASLTVDGLPETYALADSSLCFSLTIPSGFSKQIVLHYGTPDRDFAIADGDLQFNPLVCDTLAVTVHNLGPTGGPVPVQLFDGHPDSAGLSLALVTIERIEPDSSQVIKWAMGEMVSGSQRLYIVLDPHDLIVETSEQNNTASIDVSAPDQLIIDDFEYTDSPLSHGWAIDAGSGDLAVVLDSTVNSRVMEVSTPESTNFRISHTAFDTPKGRLSLKIKAEKFFILYVRVQTSSGEYYLQYTPDAGADTVLGSYIYLHLGQEYQDGRWHTIQRDLAEDVSSHLDADLSWVKFLVLRGAYRLDDLFLSGSITAIDEGPENGGPKPRAFALWANYPNPFNSTTTLIYYLSADMDIGLNIYDILGRRVAILKDGKQPQGLHSLTWDGRDRSGLPVASGIYLCVLEANGKREVRKLTLLR